MADIGVIFGCYWGDIGWDVWADTCTVDPETKAEFEEMQKTSPLSVGTNPAQSLQNFDLASWMAGKTDSGPSSSRGQSPAPGEKKFKRG